MDVEQALARVSERFDHAAEPLRAQWQEQVRAHADELTQAEFEDAMQYHEDQLAEAKCALLESIRAWLSYATFH